MELMDEPVSEEENVSRVASFMCCDVFVVFNML